MPVVSREAATGPDVTPPSPDIERYAVLCSPMINVWVQFIVKAFPKRKEKRARETFFLHEEFYLLVKRNLPADARR